MEAMFKAGAAVLATAMLVGLSPVPALARHATYTGQVTQSARDIQQQILDDLLHGRYVNSQGQRVVYRSDRDRDGYYDRYGRYHREHDDDHDDYDAYRRYGMSRVQYDSLPPGIRKRLANGKPLPPGIARQMTLLPVSYNRYLGYPAGGNIRVGVLDRDLIVFDTVRQLVLDVIRNRR